MPQLDTFTFVSQFFWFGITFWTMYVLVFCFFIIPASFIVKAQAVMRITTVSELPSVDSVSTTQWYHSSILNSFANSEKVNLENYLLGFSKNLLVSKNQISSHIFKSTDFKVIVTGYTHDGGIDIILENGTEQIGVQVKRTKNKIEVEQIRSFIGALVLGKYRKGIYVTTSTFRKGVVKTAQKLSQINKTSIELINAEKFYDALAIAQVSDDNIEDLLKKVVKISSLSYYDFDTPYKSL